ncbi:iron chaperone [Pedobacter sp. Leaf176]|uniref:iron chaperone n=1 Tax=Pedobacter sp. Leaf176 TaxID=1736286 RepID=UPI0006F71C20|nr:DUF1801 domain-containing protein [Pedobacter sp. Leaf176]KQR70204.1 hypothetical protein ASF92_09395 [Pedobacter sp. Leaf176]
MKPVEAYISQFNEPARSMLNEIRSIFFELFPDIEERISYNMPSYRNEKYTLYFAGYKNHIGFYPIGRGIELEDELSDYRAKNAKDTLHFPYNNPLPTELIKKIIMLHLTS